MKQGSTEKIGKRTKLQGKAGRSETAEEALSSDLGTAPGRRSKWKRTRKIGERKGEKTQKRVSMNCCRRRGTSEDVFTLIDAAAREESGRELGRPERGAPERHLDNDADRPLISEVTGLQKRLFRCGTGRTLSWEQG